MSPVIGEPPPSHPGAEEREPPATQPWRSLEHRGGRPLPTPEFPPDADRPPHGLERRDFLKLAGATAALASACIKKPEEKALPYTHVPRDVVPGEPRFFATSHAIDGFGVGLVVESHAGRPTKVEGNPDHPFSLGATDVFAQALTRSLYDPARAQAPTLRGEPRSLREYLEAQALRSAEFAKTGGRGLAFLWEPTSSPTLTALRQRIRRRLPEARFSSVSPDGRENRYAGARLAFGESLEQQVDYARVKCVVSLDEDFLGRGPGWVRHSREFVETRDPHRSLSRLYVVESTLSVTGMFADHRVRVRPEEVLQFGRALLHALSQSASLSRLGEFRAQKPEWSHPSLPPIAAELLRQRGQALVLVGNRQPPELHALAHLLNAALEAPVRFHPPVLDETESRPLDLGGIEQLVCTAFNPLARQPELEPVFRNLPTTVYSALHEDRTARASTWFVPALHPLESWGDLRALDGTAGVVQPLILPLFDGLTELELLAPFAGEASQSAYELVRTQWGGREDTWEQWLALGVIPETTAPSVVREVNAQRILEALSHSPSREGLSLNLVPSYSMLDGRHSQNAWLQELPDPITKLSWTNAALISPRSAARLGLQPRDRVELKLGARVLEAGVFILPGHADETVTLELGWGEPGADGEVHGFAAAALRTAEAPWFSTGLELRKLDSTIVLPTTQDHGTMHGRDIALVRSREEFTPLPAQQTGPLYRTFSYEGVPYRWGMGIDLGRCIGCSACVVACQAENNLPVVGAAQVDRGREMHWLRIDRYFMGSEDEPSVVTQPMLCQHCEAAPCEYVCPVNATVHSDEGLNEMVYNRCVGTRYCSNNCPYKVRRFNYLDYVKSPEPLVQLGFNPEVSVRSKGVMEKCTFCVQRIERARIQGRMADRPIDLASLQTACQQACPTRAITFGSLHQEDSDVARWHRDARHYFVLNELGTRPRVAYLARITNPNGELDRG